MSFTLAIKAFFKALKNPKDAEAFISGHAPAQEKNEAPKDCRLEVLALLQEKGRLVDFFQEEIASYPDADIGSCVRKIHEDCRKTLEETVALRPVVEEKEGAPFTVQPGYDPRAIKIVGNAAGAPPFKGIVRHSGWRATKPGKEAFVIYPAEIEVR